MWPILRSRSNGWLRGASRLVEVHYFRRERPLGPPVVPVYRFFLGWEGSPTKIEYRKKKDSLLTSLLEDLAQPIRSGVNIWWVFICQAPCAEVMKPWALCRPQDLSNNQNSGR